MNIRAAIFKLWVFLILADLFLMNALELPKTTRPFDLQFISITLLIIGVLVVIDIIWLELIFPKKEMYRR